MTAQFAIHAFGDGFGGIQLIQKLQLESCTPGPIVWLGLWVTAVQVC